MADVLQFGEYPSEKVFEAQDLYCVDRLTFETVAERTGMSVATLKRWSEKYDWRGTGRFRRGQIGNDGY